MTRINICASKNKIMCTAESRRPVFDNSRVRAGELPPTPGLHREQHRPGLGQDACPASHHHTLLLVVRPSDPGVTCPRAPSSAPRHVQTHLHHCRGHHGPSSGQGCLFTAGLGEEDLVTSHQQRGLKTKSYLQRAQQEREGGGTQGKSGV